MPDPPARLWLDQAKSDWATAERVIDRRNPSTYCQVIAKYQQIVEKSIKSIVAAVDQAGIVTIRIGYSHELAKLMQSLIRGSYPSRQLDVKEKIKSLIDENTRHVVISLIDLAPKQPRPGELARRNTEYPFQKSGGDWVSPCDDEVFSLAEIDQFRSLAHRILLGSDRIVSSLERHRRPRSDSNRP